MTATRLGIRTGAEEEKANAFGPAERCPYSSTLVGVKDGAETLLASTTIDRSQGATGEKKEKRSVQLPLQKKVLRTEGEGKGGVA